MNIPNLAQAIRYELQNSIALDASESLTGGGAECILYAGDMSALHVTPPADGHARENFSIDNLYAINCSSTSPTLKFSVGGGRRLSRASVSNSLLRNTGGGYAFQVTNGAGATGDADVFALSRLSCVAFDGGASFIGAGDSVKLTSPNFTGSNGLYVDQIADNATGRGDSSLFTVDDANSTAQRGLFFLNATRPRVLYSNLECPYGIGASVYGAVIAFEGAARRVSHPIVRGNYIASSATCPNGVFLGATDGAVVEDNEFGMAPTGHAIVISADAKNTRILKNKFSPNVPERQVLDCGLGTMGVTKTAALINGWAFLSYRQPVQYIKDPCLEMVTVSGSFGGGMGSTAPGAYLFVLPIGFRPEKTVSAMASGINSGGIRFNFVVHIESSGAVSIAQSSCSTASQELNIIPFSFKAPLVD